MKAKVGLKDKVGLDTLEELSQKSQELRTAFVDSDDCWPTQASGICLTPQHHLKRGVLKLKPLGMCGKHEGVHR